MRAKNVTNPTESYETHDWAACGLGVLLSFFFFSGPRASPFFRLSMCVGSLSTRKESEEWVRKKGGAALEGNLFSYFLFIPRGFFRKAQFSPRLNELIYSWQMQNKIDLREVLWARETEQPTQTLVFTKTAGHKTSPGSMLHDHNLYSSARWISPVCSSHIWYDFKAEGDWVEQAPDQQRPYPFTLLPANRAKTIARVPFQNDCPCRIPNCGTAFVINAIQGVACEWNSGRAL